MSEQYQSQSRERSSTEFETGTYIELHQSDLASVEEGRARAAAAAVFEEPARAEKTQTEMDRTKALGRTLVQMRQAEFELAA